MSCPAAIGPCAIAPDGGCLAEKTYASFPIPSSIFIQGATDHFVLTWDTPVSYPDHKIVLLLRPRSGGALLPRQEAPRDDGTITSHTGLIEGEFYNAQCRVETPTQYGDWFTRVLLVDPSWDTNSEFVLHLGQAVMHNGEVVLHSS